MSQKFNMYNKRYNSCNIYDILSGKKLHQESGLSEYVRYICWNRVFLISKKYFIFNSCKFKKSKVEILSEFTKKTILEYLKDNKRIE